MTSPLKNKADIAAFRKLDFDAQKRQIVGERFERSFRVEKDTIDREARTAWFSIASDAPYERWWGVEVLDMAKKSIRTARLENGAPFLVGHDTADMVGVVMKHELSTDKKLRILVRFSKSARAEEIWQDVLDEIRVNTSVGYIIHDLVLEKQEADVCTYRVTDWEPLEGSTVPVPADFTVGLGRSHEQPTSAKDIMDPKDISPELRAQIAAEERTKLECEAAERAAAAANDPAAVQAREQARTTGILAAGDEYAAQGGPELARELIKDATATLDTFKARMLEKLRGKTTPLGTAQPGENPTFGSGARHIIRMGPHLRAFAKPIVYSDGSRMEPQEAAWRSAQWLLATIGQNERAARWCREHGLGENISHRVMTTDSGSAGGYTVPDEMEQGIIDLREAYGLARRLARRRPMATDTKSVPKRTGGVTAYFVNEDQSGVTASDKSWGNVNFVAKTLAALSLLSKNLEEDSAIDVVNDLAMEQAWAFAKKEDQCWLIGDGTSTYGGMTGLKVMFEATAYASRFTAASGHDTFPEFDNADLTGTRAVVADFPGLNPSWLCSKAFAEGVMNRLKAVAGGNNIATLEGRPRYNYLGDDAYTTEIMPKDPAADVTNVICAFYGDFSMSSSFADRRGIVVEVLRERYAEKLQVGVLAHERFHIVNHDVGTTSVTGPVAGLLGGT